ncbi:polysaccharide biosynthesis tyrosine autokinase [Oceanobacillus sp. 143]|uniref:non-specific protein-tyrosine kinase n=1 Tax=Oceanobacillus zhaokaii TaxID=2052660 RepID=A0A345PLA8_9BACI|nr:CpsD/CapB family tyrosine-protein kinase [Oceanobacillus zhaokaii]AXI10788.1 tyrosine protein kinase [Oceanobacillus zhaokaii]QGS69690.1 polysaccharide biosynthesis tyrosine autokinase [Oceanobacillus sp. 143]
MILNKRKSVDNRKIHLITYSNADSVISDQFRTIRTNIKFLMDEKKNSVFLITSPGIGEGKSTTAANLAVSIAQQKESVLLIDANLREPIIQNIFQISNETGLTNVLEGNTLLKQAISRTDIKNVDVLTSGSSVLNPTEILGSDAMMNLLNEASARYNVVLIDSPTILRSTETRVLANQCEGVVLVLEHGKTELESAIESKRILELAHANLLGVIINDK